VLRKTVFECDICKAQGISIFTAKISVQKTILSGNEEKNHSIPPMEATVQVCSLPCLHKAIDEKFNFGMAQVEIKKEEVKTNGDSPRDTQPNLEEGKD